MPRRSLDKSKTYQRKISAVEAREQYLFVTKNRLDFFPPAPTPFSLRVGKDKLTVRIESYPCTCRGPELPHQHYFVRCKGLTAGATAIVTFDGEHRYSLSFPA